MAENDICAEEKHRILNTFNQTTKQYPIKTIIDLFEEQVEKNPDLIAVVFNDIALTYRELNSQSNCVAHYLRKMYCLKPEDLIAVLLDRSEKMIIALLGILKSGAAYLPIDPDYPESRIAFMLSDSNPKAVLSEKNRAIPARIHSMDIDAILGSDHGCDNPEHMATPEHLAYAIYTSGSTGKPKGTLIANASVVNFIQGISDQIEFNEKKTILSVTTYTFDIFVLESFVPLAKGAKVIIASKDELNNVSALKTIIQKHQVDMIQTTPSRMLIFTADDALTEAIGKLSDVVIGGEVFPRKLYEILTKTCSGNIYNVYGPTETTVWSTLKKIEQNTKLTIGKPIANTQIYILDDCFNSVPIGKTGEMYIAGKGLAQGYLNRPELTQAKFMDNPFCLGERMYRTGDLGRWLSNGEIEILGRADFQVKIRGYRIEMEEIENTLLQHEYINAAVVNAFQTSNGVSELAAYYISSQSITVSELRAFLERILPDYMLPSYFIPIQKIPLNSSGKIDRKALPDPLKEKVYTGEPYSPPRNKTEKKLSKVWCKILGHKRIGIAEDFFVLGGHSMKAVEIIAEIKKELGIKISLKEFFENPTVELLGKWVDQLMTSKSKQDLGGISPVEKKAYYPVSTSQKGLFIVNQLHQNTVYNEPIICKLEGTLDTGRVKAAIQVLMDKHESLRMYFAFKEGVPVQMIGDEVTAKLEMLEADEQQLSALIKNFVHPFNLSEGPLIRFAIVRIEEEVSYLLVDMHHIITDAISQNILIEEFAKAYRGEEIGRLIVQYKDYAQWQNTSEQQRKRAEQEKYWLRYLKGTLPVLNLPLDFPRASVQDFKGATVNLELSECLTNQIDQWAREMKCTQFMVLMTAYALLLYKYTGQKEILIGYPVSNRKDPVVQPIIGYFINSLVMRCLIDEDETCEEFLEKVKIQTLNGFENSEYPFEDLVNALGVQRDLSRSSLFSVSLNMDVTNSERFVLDEYCKGTMVEYLRDTTKFDLLMRILEKEKSLNLCLEYAVSLFSEETAQRIQGHFVEIIEQMVGHKALCIKDIVLSHVFYAEAIEPSDCDFDF